MLFKFYYFYLVYIYVFKFNAAALIETAEKCFFSEIYKCNDLRII